MSTEKPISPLAIGLRYGVLAGLICVLITLTLYLLGAEKMFGFWGLSGFAVIIFLKIWAVYYLVRQKKYIRFKEGLQCGFLVSVISLLMWTVFVNLLVGVIDPSLIEVQKKTAIENASKWMQKFNVPKDKIEETLDTLEQEDYSPKFLKSAMNYAFFLFIGFIYAALISFIFRHLSRKNRPLNLSPN